MSGSTALERKVDQIHATVVRIDAMLQERCGPAQRRLSLLELELDGQPGNGDHPGLKTRVAVVEKSLGGIHLRYRVVIGAVISLLVSVAGAAIVWAIGV